MANFVSDTNDRMAVRLATSCGGSGERERRLSTESGGPYGIDARAHKVKPPGERSAQIIQLGRARVWNAAQRLPAMQNGGSVRSMMEQDRSHRMRRTRLGDASRAPAVSGCQDGLRGSQL